MQKKFEFLKRILFVLLVSTSLLSPRSFLLAQEKTSLKIDPLMFVALKESRNIAQQLGSSIYPGWQFSKTPVLFYKPKVQEILINFPYKPKGFKEYTGFHPLGNEKIYYRNDTTFFDIDGQNTRLEIDSITVLVVADRASNLRNELYDLSQNRPKEFIKKYLDNWDFISSPYDDIALLLHESFHAYQFKKAPEKNANEAVLMKYPTLDPVNNAFYVLEGNILKDALLTTNPSERLEKIKQFIAVKSYRQSLLDSSLAEYENINEYSEGIAKYIEFAFAKKAAKTTPVREMYFYPNFNGYGNGLAKYLENKITQMANFASVNNDAFENKFGTGPVRFRLYGIGACEGLLLDELMPNWKEKIFADNVYLIDLLKQAVNLSSAQQTRYLELAKKNYGYEQALSEKTGFQKLGLEFAQQKANRILNTEKSLVRIHYGSVTDKVFLYRFTPFGITRVNTQTVIYDMVPLLLGFKDGVELDMKQAYPVIMDKEKKQIIFAASIPAKEIKLIDKNKIDNTDFTISGIPMEITVSGNVVDIKMKQ
jgi:hypothetical protein